MVVSYIHTLNYTESNCIHVVGGYKMPIYRAKHEYIQHYLYILSPTCCNRNPPVTFGDLPDDVRWATKSLETPDALRIYYVYDLGIIRLNDHSRYHYTARLSAYVYYFA